MCVLTRLCTVLHAQIAVHFNDDSSPISSSLFNKVTYFHRSPRISQQIPVSVRLFTAV